MGTNKEQKITITASSNLSEDEINKAVKEAEMHAEEDKKHREYIETKNQADNLVYTMEKTLKENGDKISEEDKTKLEQAIEKAKKDFESTETEDLRKGMEELSKVSNEVMTKLYQNASANAQANEQTAQNDSDPEVVVEDENDNK